MRWKHAVLSPDFLKLWLGQTISQFGTWLGALGLLAILDLNATPAQMGTLESLRALPVLLVGLFAGVWVDRVRRRPILVASDVGRALLLGGVVLLAGFGSLRMGHLYVASFLLGTLTVFFNIAYRSYVPALVARGRLVTANSRLSASESLAEIAGPGLGGALVQSIGAPLALFVDALTFGISAFFVVSIDRVEPRPRPASRATPRVLWREMQEGLRFLWATPQLRSLLGAGATRNFFGGFFAALYSLYVLREVGLSPAALGILIGSGGVGALLGALLLNRVTERFGVARTLIGAMLLSGVMGFLVPLAVDSGRLSVLLLLSSQLIGDLFLMFYMILAVSLRQLYAPPGMLGRVNSSFDLVADGVGTVGIFIGGVMGSMVGSRFALAVAVVGMLFAVLWLLISPLRSLHSFDEVPAPAAPPVLTPP